MKFHEKVLIVFMSTVCVVQIYRKVFYVQPVPEIEEALRAARALPFIPPYFQFQADYFTAYQYTITSCSIRKSMSQMVFNTMCLLHDSNSFLNGNHSINETWKANRTCNYEDDDGFARFPDEYKNSSIFTRLVFIRDPFDRFLSLYLDKCVREGFCFDCTDDMRCVVEKIYKSLTQQYLSIDNHMADFMALHSAPLSWFCNFDKYLKTYHTLIIGPDIEDRQIPIKKLSDILKKKNVPPNIILKIVEESFLGETSHGTHNLEHRKIAEEQIKNDPVVREYLHKIYFNDYLIFPFDRSSLDSEYQTGNWDEEFKQNYSDIIRIQNSYARLLN